MKLSICMMVKNEEKYLDKCLKSLQQLRNAVSSELIIVDTGSNDNTVTIAKKHTDKVYFHEWNNNFSEMRNISIGYAKGEWVFIIDADEELEDEKEILKFFNSKISTKFNAASLTVKNFTTTDNNSMYVLLESPRIFKRDGYFKYEGIVHNIPKFKGDCYKIQADLLHYGYIESDSELMEKKFKRTADLLKSELEKDPDNIYYRFQLSNSYQMHGDFSEGLEEAIKAYNIMLRKGKDPKNYLNIYCQLIKCYLANEYFLEAEKYCIEAKNLNKEYLDIYFYLARAQFYLDKLDNALLNYKEYIKLVENYKSLKISLDPTILMYSLGLIDEAYYNMAVIYYKKECYEEAFEYVSKITKFNYIEMSYILFIELAIKLKKFNSLKKYCDNVLKNYREELQESIIFQMEKFKALLAKDEEVEFEKIFSSYDDSYGDLNKIRVAFKSEDNNIESMIQRFIEKVDLNLTHDFYGDIIYYLMKLEYPIEELLYGISNENIAMYMEYLINKYEDFNNIILEYVRGMNIGFFEQLTTSILLKRCLLISDRSDISKEQYKEVFNDYISNGIQYITTVYTPFVIESELTKEVKSEEDKFFIYMCLAENIKEQNQKEYINYLRKAISAYPYMKDGIEILLRDFHVENSSVQDEFEQYKLQIKETIKEFICNGDLNNAEALIEEYEQIVKNDVEMVLVKSEIAVKKIQEMSNKNYKM